MHLRFARPFLAIAALTVPVLVACSGSHEDTAQSDEALTCGPGLRSVCTDTGGYPPRLACGCEQVDAFYTVAHAATAGADQCTTTVLAPTILANRGCTNGIMVKNQPVWLCPSTATLPSTLGIVSWPLRLPLTFPEMNAGWSEAVVGFTSSTSNCLNTAPSGWKFVADTEYGSGEPQKDDGGNGGCAGQCGTGSTGVGGTILGGKTGGGY